MYATFAARAGTLALCSFTTSDAPTLRANQEAEKNGTMTSKTTPQVTVWGTENAITRNAKSNTVNLSKRASERRTNIE